MKRSVLQPPSAPVWRQAGSDLCAANWRGTREALSYTAAQQKLEPSPFEIEGHSEKCHVAVGTESEAQSSLRKTARPQGQAEYRLLNFAPKGERHGADEEQE